jgi:hypothetical protein
VSTAGEHLDAMLVDIAERIRRAQAFEHDHGLGSIDTRKMPASLLRMVRRWRENGAA